MDKQLPHSIPIFRIIAPFIFIIAFSAWITWKLSLGTVLKSENTTYARLLQQDWITCEWPRFSLWDHSQLTSTSFTRSIECPSTQPSLASLESGYLTVSSPLSPEFPGARCSYFALSLNSTGGLQYSQETEIQFDSREKVVHDQFVVRCSQDSRIIYEEAFFNPSANRQKRTRANRDGAQYAASEERNPSIAILLLDDISQAHFARNLPRTTKLMMQEDFYMPSRYSQLYSDSAANLELLLNGNDNTSLMNLMRGRGCATFFNDEAPSPGDSTISMEADIETKAMHVVNRERQQNEHCMANGKSKVSSVLGPMVEFSSEFRQECSLSITHLRSPRNRTLIGAIDEELSSALSRLMTMSSNTVIFVMSPSGLKSIGSSGVVEGKTPLLSAWFPMEFRRTRNELYSVYAYNMDKLITTRDVRETLRQLAAADLPKIVEWLDWDIEHNQTVSLFAEMLPEERNCTTLHIPQENCVCLETDKKRNATINDEGILYKKVYDLVESRALQQPCIDSIEEDKRWFFINSYQMVSQESDKESRDVEWLTLLFWVKILKSRAIHSGNYGGGSGDYVHFKTTVRHYISSGHLEYVEAVIIKSYECFAVHLERLCSLCYSNPFWLLSSPGPNKGFLYDIAAEP